MTSTLQPNISIRLDLSCNFFLYSKFSSVMTTLITYRMHFDGCATVGTNSQSSYTSFVMSSSLVSSCFRCFSFWMCHLITSFYLLFLFINFFNSSHRGSIGSSSSISSSSDTEISLCTIYSSRRSSISGSHPGVPSSLSG